uniref:Granzyme A n=1 Tax=Callorhinchus milii TaxID=7868 RepID=A0A4W3K974_CALMI
MPEPRDIVAEGTATEGGTEDSGDEEEARPGYDCVEIIGGSKVRSHSKPYMASIQAFNKTRKRFTHVCGGALIKPNWILTAAHCKMELMGKKQVVLGALSLSKKEKGKQIFIIKDMIVYPSFNHKQQKNDIMLLKLKSKAKPNSFVNFLPLPKSGDDVKVGTKCNVAGWGITAAGNSQPSDMLQEVNITIIDRKKCSEYYKNNSQITDDMLCAGDKRGGKDACQGDSGGPLICKRVFRGIVSFGDGCGKPKKPGVYTRLSKKYLSWINSRIKASSNTEI